MRAGEEGGGGVEDLAAVNPNMASYVNFCLA